MLKNDVHRLFSLSFRDVLAGFRFYLYGGFVKCSILSKIYDPGVINSTENKEQFFHPSSNKSFLADILSKTEDKAKKRMKPITFAD